MDIRPFIKKIHEILRSRIIFVSTLAAGLILAAAAALLFSPLMEKQADAPGATPPFTPIPAVTPSPHPVATPSPTHIPSPSPTPTPLAMVAMAREYAGENGDVVGWIRVEGTVIDYPVTHTGDNAYYMDHNIRKKKDKKGAIFLDYRCDPVSMGGNNILYGHHMRDGSMFAGLMAYKDKAFCEVHPVIQYATLQAVSEWEVFSVFVTGTDYDYIRTAFNSDAAYVEFLRIMQGKSLYDTGIMPDAADDILILSTCTYEYEDARFAVAARRKQ